MDDEFLAARTLGIVATEHVAEQLRHTAAGILQTYRAVVEARIAAATPILNSRANPCMM